MMTPNGCFYGFRLRRVVVLHDTVTCRCHHAVPQYSNPKKLVKRSSWFSLEVICIYNILAGVHNRFWSKDNITTNTFGYRCLHISVQRETPKERRLDRVSITGCFNEGAYNTSPDQVSNLVVFSFRVSQHKLS